MCLPNHSKDSIFLFDKLLVKKLNLLCGVGKRQLKLTQKSTIFSKDKSMSSNNMICIFFTVMLIIDNGFTSQILIQKTVMIGNIKCVTLLLDINYFDDELINNIII